MIDDQDEIDYDVRYVELSNTGRRGTKWTFKEDFRDEKKYLENYGNPLATVYLKKVLLVLEKSEEKVSLKFFTYIKVRGCGNIWFKKSTSLTYVTYNIKTNCLYYGSSNDYHKKRKGNGRTFHKNGFAKKPFEALSRFVKNEISYFIIPNMTDKNQKNKMVDEYIDLFVRHIPTVKYNGLLSWDELLFKNYLDINNIKYPNNWNLFIEMFPLPLKREYKKNGNKLVDTFMFKNGLVGDKIKKIIHQTQYKFNVDLYKNVIGFFGEDFIRSQSEEFLLSLVSVKHWYTIPHPPITNKKCRHNAFSVYQEMLKNDDIHYTYMDHVRMYHFLNRF